MCLCQRWADLQRNPLHSGWPQCPDVHLTVLATGWTVRRWEKLFFFPSGLLSSNSSSITLEKQQQHFLQINIVVKQSSTLFLSSLMWPKQAVIMEIMQLQLPFSHLRSVLNHSLFLLSLALRYGLPKVPLPTVCQIQPLPPVLHLNRSKNIHLQLLEWWVERYQSLSQNVAYLCSHDPLVLLRPPPQGPVRQQQWLLGSSQQRESQSQLNRSATDTNWKYLIWLTGIIQGSSASAGGIFPHLCVSCQLN